MFPALSEKYPRTHTKITVLGLNYRRRESLGTNLAVEISGKTAWRRSLYASCSANTVLGRREIHMDSQGCLLPDNKSICYFTLFYLLWKISNVVVQTIL